MEIGELKKLFDDMTIEEKAGQLFQTVGAMYDDEAVISGPMQEMGITEKDIQLAGTVLGTMGAEKIKRIQKKYMEAHPHHSPLVFMLDIINGYKTVYPIPLAQGATFQPDLVKECAAMAAKEGAADGLHITFSPMVDLVRDARWGRVMESTGEDVYLNGLYARAMVEGYQGADISGGEKLGACVKHFAGYGGAEAGRDYNTVEVSERTFRDFYLPAYKEAVEAGSALVMTSFNTINGIPASVNKWLMRDILREEMGFDGVLISDFGAIGECVNHGAAEDRADATKKALEAGVDIDMMSGTYPENIPALLKDKSISVELIEECAWRIMKLKNDLGLFENPYKGADEIKAKACILSEAHRELAQKTAENSFVLLKNKDNILPLDKKKKIAMIGPYIDRRYMLGGWSFTGNPEDVITIKNAAEEKLADYEIVYAQGCPILSEDVKLEGFANYTEEKFSQEDCEKMKEEALRAAKEADVVVLAIGEHFLQSGEATSKGIIEIPKIQQELFEALSEVNSEIAVVLFNGRPLDIRILEERAKAILEVWMPGTMGGAAIVEVLRGAVSPAGKLPMSFPYCVSQVPVHYDEFPTGRRHHPGKDKDRYVSKYLDMPNKPLYSFGYGLTYTQFEISDLELSKTVMKPGESVTVSVKVKNTGDREGTETLQLYIHDIAGSVVRPVKQLKGFERVILNAGEEKEVCFTVDEKMLRFLRADNTFGSEPGKFEVFIGNSSEVEECKVFELLKG